MKKILLILFVILPSLNTLSHPTINYLSEPTIQSLIDQAEHLSKQGLSQKEIIKIFKQSLRKQELSVAKPKKKDLRLIESILCISLGAAITYLIMDYKLREAKAQNPVHVIHQIFQPTTQEPSIDIGKELSNFADFCGEKIQTAGTSIRNFIQNMGI